ncbi:lipid-binding protein [Zunongwangia sp. F363]|uniref:Lipid-binding protein n=1 Tax=Autumnicola tepida TaxID=3075595 RepID=A0ABU3CBP9_9FLAO|nr:lipid-binding protein [Zunongwangia sp. F363]MDT0643760.1 lipid-binding protein [Zunongwangia sp. F363]
MKRTNNIKFLLLLFIGIALVSCDAGGDPDPGETEVVELAGDWYVQLLIDGEDVHNLGYNLISTYNTAEDNGEEMWVDDHELWPMKVSTPVNVQELTFSGSSLNNLYSYEDDGEVISPEVDITNGKVLIGAATTTGGNITDSIHMNLQFADNPGTIYTLAGYRRTGFLEDEH